MSDTEAWMVDTDSYIWVFLCETDAHDKAHDLTEEGIEHKVIRLIPENGMDALRAEVRDLKARLKALRARWCDCGGCLDCEAVARIGNLRLKNWRKP